MSSNMLIAIKNIINNPIGELRSFYTSRNRANSMGDALENYIKDVFAGTLQESDEQKRIEQFSQVFSYLGNQNNPPDMIIRGGDAIEVKKIENPASALALNSSYPKYKLCADSRMISKACRECEEWEIKDMIYTVGVVNGNSLSKLFFVYGVDYAANSDVYENRLTEPLDPQEITFMKNRVKCEISDFTRLFGNYQISEDNSKFELVALISNDKYSEFPEKDRYEFENFVHKCDNFEIFDTTIKVPDNPEEIRPAKLMRYYLEG